MCEWNGCLATATHTVVVSFPGQPPETWHTCRAHDRVLKFDAVRSRPKRPRQVDVPVPNEVRCGDCGRVLEQRSDVAAHERRPCPNCGSLVRNINVHLSETLTFHDTLRARTKRSGKGGWILDTMSGDNYTRDLEAWGKRGLTMDKEKDLYHEVIELWDGTRIESSARLRDHRD